MRCRAQIGRQDREGWAGTGRCPSILSHLHLSLSPPVTQEGHMLQVGKGEEGGAGEKRGGDRGGLSCCCHTQAGCQPCHLSTQPPKEKKPALPPSCLHSMEKEGKKFSFLPEGRGKKQGVCVCGGRKEGKYSHRWEGSPYHKGQEEPPWRRERTDALQSLPVLLSSLPAPVLLLLCPAPHTYSREKAKKLRP